MVAKLRILIVDDSEIERFTIGETLKNAGHFVFFAENGEQGVAQTKALLPDVVIMDVVMPDINGFQACRRITTDEETKKIPVIMCTTKGQDSDKTWGKRQGAFAHVVKPILQEELLRLVDESQTQKASV